MPKQSPRKNLNWFSIERIAQMLSEETGESADALERDLEKWNSDFIRQKESTITETSDDDGETTRLFYGSLFRQIQRKVIEAYCSDRGYKKPSLWLSSSVGRSNLSGPIVVEARLAGQPGRSGNSECGPQGRDENDIRRRYRSDPSRLDHYR